MRIVLPADRPKHDMSLPDGTPVTLSPVLKSDREFFASGLQEMSIDSRFARFGHGVAHLSEEELDYLSDVNQRSHVAWGAAVGGEVAGVGRYILPEGGDCAEIAITVLDRMQGRGIGTALLRALVSVARADGISQLCFETRADNVAVRRMLGESEIGVVRVLDDGTIESRVRVADLPHGGDEAAFLSVIDEVRT